jgi:hypothetical protein
MSAKAKRLVSDGIDRSPKSNLSLNGPRLPRKQLGPPPAKWASGTAIVNARLTAPPPVALSFSNPLRFRLQSWRRCLDFCPYRSLVAHRRANRDDRAGVKKAKFGVSTYSAYAIYAINSSPRHRRILDIL